MDEAQEHTSEPMKMFVTRWDQLQGGIYGRHYQIDLPTRAAAVG